MNCIKCGRDTVSDQVFCPDCQADMAKHPVQPGTIVQLPNRKEFTPRRTPSKRRTVSLEDQVRSLKVHVRRLSIALFIASALAALLAWPAVRYLMEDHFEIGQNYTAIVSTTAPVEAE